MKNGGCQKRCLEARKDAARLTERGGNAERRERLEGQLREVKTEATASGGPSAARGSTGIVDAVLFLALIEGLVWLNMVGMGLLHAAWTAKPAAKAKAEAVTKPKAAAKPRKSKAKPKTLPVVEPIAIDRTASLDRIMREVRTRKPAPSAVN